MFKDARMDLLCKKRIVKLLREYIQRRKYTPNPTQTKCAYPDIYRRKQMYAYAYMHIHIPMYAYNKKQKNKRTATSFFKDSMAFCRSSTWPPRDFSTVSASSDFFCSCTKRAPATTAAPAAAAGNKGFMPPASAARFSAAAARSAATLDSFSNRSTYTARFDSGLYVFCKTDNIHRVGSVP